MQHFGKMIVRRRGTNNLLQMTNKWTQPQTKEWKPTKTPNKRAAAVARRLALLHHLYALCKDGWIHIPMQRLGRSYRINYSMKYLLASGIVEKKHGKYRWRGQEPTRELAEAWCDFQMTYSRIRRDRNTPLKPDIASTLNAISTADARADKIEGVLVWCYRALHRSYKKISLSSELVRRGMPHQAIRHLIDRGCLERPRNGRYKWVGPPPDRELTLWLFGMLAEHHRAIYRSKMEDKVRRTKLVDDLIGRAELPSSESVEVEPKEGITATKSSYWSQGTSTW